MSEQYGVRNRKWPRGKRLPPVEEPCPKCGGKLSQDVKYPTAAHPSTELIVSCYNKNSEKWNDFCGFVWRRKIELRNKEQHSTTTDADSLLNSTEKKQIKAVKPKVYKIGMRRYKSK